MKAPKTTGSGSSINTGKLGAVESEDQGIVHIKQIGRKDKRLTRFCNCPSNSAIRGKGALKFPAEKRRFPKVKKIRTKFGPRS
ncbi:hypothetical protein AAG906_035231 [Vitis piasezkii]